MPRVHCVKIAGRYHVAAGVKGGESYYWWVRSGRASIKRYSQPSPRRSPLTRNEFFVLGIDILDRIARRERRMAAELLTGRAGAIT